MKLGAILFLLIGLCSAWAQQSQPPVLSQIGKERQPPQNQTTPKQNPTTSVTEKIAPVSHDEKSAAEREDATQNSPSKWRDPITWFTLMLVIIGGFQAFIYWSQRNVMKSTLDETKKAADAAKISAETARRSLEFCEAADLQIVGMNLAPFLKAEPTAKFCFRYKNFGRTTATDVVSKIRFRDGQKINAHTTPTIIAPSDFNHIEIALNNIQEPFTQEECDRINSGVEKFIAVIETTYLDVLDTRQTVNYVGHWSTRDRAFGTTCTKTRKKRDET